MYLCAVNNILAEIMPRQERLQSATGIYHVMLRGINKQDIFEDDEWIISPQITRGDYRANGRAQRPVDDEVI